MNYSVTEQKLPFDKSKVMASLDKIISEKQAEVKAFNTVLEMKKDVLRVKPSEDFRSYVGYDQDMSDIVAQMAPAAVKRFPWPLTQYPPQSETNGERIVMWGDKQFPQSEFCQSADECQERLEYNNIARLACEAAQDCIVFLAYREGIKNLKSPTIDLNVSMAITLKLYEQKD